MSLNNNFRNSNYNRILAKNYSLTYCGKMLGVYDSTGYNKFQYPIYNSPNFPQNDCTNFISQALFAGGKQMTGVSYTSFGSWFCHTKSHTNLSACSLTWRSASHFRHYWINKVKLYKEIPWTNAYYQNDFEENIWNLLDVSDVIQFAKDYGTPYHTLIVTDKQLNPNKDILVSSHSINRCNSSLFDLIKLKKSLIIIYHFDN
ncbi:MAG: amidase domain-containing protein [Bacillota bacterium]|nr:amidase domain-containing protein [Bacillota bacterium]